MPEKFRVIRKNFWYRQTRKKFDFVGACQWLRCCRSNLSILTQIVYLCEAAHDRGRHLTTVDARQCRCPCRWPVWCPTLKKSSGYDFLFVVCDFTSLSRVAFGLLPSSDCDLKQFFNSITTVLVFKVRCRPTNDCELFVPCDCEAFLYVFVCFYFFLFVFFLHNFSWYDLHNK